MKVDMAAIEAALGAHPWRSIALALAGGIAIGLVELNRRGERIVRGALRAFALPVLETVIARETAGHARSWFDARVQAQPGLAAPRA